VLHAPAKNRGEPMCEKCKELDGKIAHYRRFTGDQFDALTTKRIEGLIADTQKIRDAMHPEGPRRLGFLRTETQG
jgi:hypothetical protein